MPLRGSLITPNSFPGSSWYRASCLLSVKWSAVTMKTVDFLPGEGSLSTRARMRFMASKSSNHDLSFSDSGPELGSLSLASVLGVEQYALYDSHVLLVDHGHGGHCLVVSSSV